MDSAFLKAAQACKAAGGILDANICTVRKDNRRLIIHMWTPFTKEQPEKHVNNIDLITIFRMAKEKPKQDIQFTKEFEKLPKGVKYSLTQSREFMIRASPVFISDEDRAKRTQTKITPEPRMVLAKQDR